MGAVPALVHWFVQGVGVNGAHLTLGVRGFLPATTHGGSATHFIPVSTSTLRAEFYLELVEGLDTNGYGRAMTGKAELRQTLRAGRRDHVAALPEAIRSLVFHRPPAPLLDLVPDKAAIGLYAANPHEAPAAAYARFFFEIGHELALPRFATRGAAMEFARFTDPFEESDLEVGPFGLMQPVAEATVVVPELLFVPLLGFTERGERLGQGGGHYDRWLVAHPASIAIGLAWDCQLVETLPAEPHDRALAAVVTPTRLYGPF